MILTSRDDTGSISRDLSAIDILARSPCNILSKRKVNAKRPWSVESNYELSCIIFILNAYRIYIYIYIYNCSLLYMRDLTH